MNGPQWDLLVLDDDEALTDAIAALLETSCLVRVTNDVAHARLELQRRRADCLLCDYWLGNATSVDFLRSVADAAPCTRRVLMSGSPLTTIRPLLDAGLVDAFLAKPFDIETALPHIRGVGTVGRACGRRGTMRCHDSLARGRQRW
jgi:DNA-binding NtrC family response regulator